MGEVGKHEAPGKRLDDAMTGGRTAPLGFLGELRDSISVRTVVLVVGVLLLELGFILSYVGAFHAPRPHRIPIAVVAPAQEAPRLVTELNRISGHPLDARRVSSAAAARTKIENGSTSAALVVDPTSKTDVLLVASGGGTSVVTATEQVAHRVEASQQRSLTVTDVVPLQAGDGRGLTGFYLVVGWLVGGYLVAALLGIARGAAPPTTRRAFIRLLAIVPYAILSGLGGALVVDQGLGAVTGHFVALWWLGVLLVFGAAAVTMAFQVLLGVLGIGVAVLVFVVFGNPSAGGAYQPALLPPFWRAISGALPNGAGTDSVRRIVYFHGHSIGGHLMVLAIWAAVGAIVALIASALRQRRVA